nr:VRR-NUC domain-containing protein [uncultured Parasutterella sp.]
MTTPEGQNTLFLKQACKKLGITAFKLGFEGTVGAPDWLLMRDGRHILIELKAKKGRLSPQQQRMIRTLEDEGAFEVFVCHDAESIKTAICWGLFGGVNVTRDL